jgi:predicted nucleic acid-binding protein
MILVDANVLMYAAGAPHPHKEPSVVLLKRVASGAVEAVLDAEVLQEILHRYRSIGRWEDGREVYDRARRIFPVVLPVTAELLDRARVLLDEHRTLMARDALHAAFVLEHRLAGICSFDADLDVISGLIRHEPNDIS